MPEIKNDYSHLVLSGLELIAPCSLHPPPNLVVLIPFLHGPPGLSLINVTQNNFQFVLIGIKLKFSVDIVSASGL